MLRCARFLVVITVALLSGCATKYVTPGGPADLSKITTSSIRESFAAEPAASFPANIAVLRLQGWGYQSHNLRAYNLGGDYSAITSRDFEEDTDLKRLQSMPKVEGVATLNRLLFDTNLKGDEQLRTAAAKLHADILFIYTMDTTFVDTQHSAPLSFVTLGFLPTKNVTVSSTASGLIMDVRSGFVYGVAEDTQRAKDFAGVWTTDDAVEMTRRKTERKAFDTLLGTVEKLWAEIVARHAS